MSTSRGIGSLSARVWARKGTEFYQGKHLLAAAVQAELNLYSDRAPDWCLAAWAFKRASEPCLEVLYDLDPQKKPWAFASISLAQAHT